MGIKNLPKVGHDFRVRGTASSFDRKLRSASKHGLKHLKAHTEIISNVVDDYKDYIKYKGGLSRLQKISAWKKIKKNIGDVKTQTRRDIKKILGNLGKNDNRCKVGSNNESRPMTFKEKKAIEVKKRRNIAESRMSAERTGTEYQKSTVQYISQKVETSSRIGSSNITEKESNGFGLKNSKPGFAGQTNKNNVQPESLPKVSKGNKPMGF